MTPSPDVVGKSSAPRSQHLRLWKRVLACCVLASFWASAETERNPVEQLYSNCKRTIAFVETPDGGGVSTDMMAGHIACTEYLNGLTDGLFVAEAFKNPLVCFPDRVEYQRLARIVVKYIDDHPGTINEGKRVVALRALVAAYPCPPAE